MSRSQPAALCTVLALLMVGSLPISESVPTEKNIVVYQNTYNDYGTVYRMESSGFPGHGYSRVDGTNSPPGAASYVRGYTRAYPPEYHRSCRICNKYLVRGGFETTLKVCSIRQQTQGGAVRIFHAFVPSDACEWVNQYVSNAVETTVRPVTTAYVSRVYREAENPRRFVATLCRGYGDLLYGTVSTEDGFCQPGDGIINRFEFFAYGGHKFCPELQDGGTWSIMYTRQHGVRETTALYSCSTGYALEDGDGQLQCSSIGMWLGMTPTCQPINCGSPPHVANGHFEGEDFSYMATVTLECSLGYEASDSYVRLQCQATGHWSQRNLQCEPRSCSYPASPQNGRVVMSTGYSYLDEIAYECGVGYRLEGSASAICTESGDWSTVTPVCHKIVCEALLQPLHGSRYGDNFDVGAVVAFSCFQGFEMFGPSELTCEQHGGQGQWSGRPPVCDASDCGLPAPPDNGNVRADATTFGSRVDFECNTGYLLVGVDYATCTSEGWDAVIPECQQITCPEPTIPVNSRRQGDDFSYGSIVVYSCDNGYTISGTNTIICQETGAWSDRIPRCIAVECPPLPPINNGTRAGDQFEFSIGVTFSCFPGFELIGDRTTSCLEDGQWSHAVPRCQACAIGMYKEGVDGDTCQPCPEHSTTLVPASSSIDHCICKPGTTASDDGQTCEALRCPDLEAPENGMILECDENFEGLCSFDCNAGFVLRGQDTTVCGNYGWTHPVPFCQACPANTFKASEGSLTCHPCPRNTHTNGLPGTQPEDCVCREGYARSGAVASPCVDVNECDTDNGGCSQLCDNTLGNYTCRCSRPGFEVAEDGHTCYAAEFCPELPNDPYYGSLDCRHNEEENGYICFIHCNAGFFFVSGHNKYITCGQETDFHWSHQLVNTSAAIPGCTEEFFVDTQLPISFAYDVTVSCEQVSQFQGDITDLIQDRVYHLEACAARCSIVDMHTECADAEEGVTNRLGVGFDIRLRNMQADEVNPLCGQDCRMLNMRQLLNHTFFVAREITALITSVQGEEAHDEEATSILVDPDSFEYGRPDLNGTVGADCDSTCKQLNMRQMLGETFGLKTEIEQLVQQSDPDIHLEGQTDLVVVDTDSFAMGSLDVICLEPGRVFTSNRQCVPCDAGYFLPNPDDDSCTPCPIGTYQRFQGSTECVICPEDSTTIAEGSSHSTMCSERISTIEGQSMPEVPGENNTMSSNLEDIDVDEVLAFL